MGNILDPINSLSSREKKTISVFLKDFSGEKLILFGSKARGDSRKSSDIDLLAVVKNKKAEEQIYANVAKALSLFGIYLSVKTFPKSEFERITQLETPFIENINREGIILWQRP